MFDELLEEAAAEATTISRAILSGQDTPQPDSALRSGLRLAQRLLPVVVMGLIVAGDQETPLMLCGRGC